MKPEISASLDMIESLCKHNRNWSHHCDEQTPQLVVKQIGRIREILEGEKPVFSGERGRFSAIIDSGVRSAFRDWCAENRLPVNKTLEKALLKYIEKA